MPLNYYLNISFDLIGIISKYLNDLPNESKNLKMLNTIFLFKNTTKSKSKERSKCSLMFKCFPFPLPESLVHRCEVDDSVRIDIVLVQRPPGLVQPLVPVGPPDGVIRPVHGDI